jgi:hypothetical protein
MERVSKAEYAGMLTAVDLDETLWRFARSERECDSALQ